MFLRILILSVLCASAFSKVKVSIVEPTHHEKHYDSEGHHNAQYDSEAVFGKDAEELKHMTDDQAREKLGKALDKMDLNHDDKISKDELEKWIATQYKQLDREDSDKHLDELDTDTDKKMSWPEVLHYLYGYLPDELEKLVGQNNEDALSVAKYLPTQKHKFHVADTNQDGGLNEDEFYNFNHPQVVKALSDIQTNETLHEHDADQDGKISLEEYLKDKDSKHIEFDTNDFKERDKNSDGYLDFEEIRNWVVPSYEYSASIEVEHLVTQADENKDGILSREEIMDHAQTFTGSNVIREGHEEL